MATVTIFHNPHWNSSVNAVRIAEESGVAANVVLYMKTPPDAATLDAIIDKLEDPVTALVRRDSLFTKLGLREADVATREQVVKTLVAHKALLQRPIVVTEEKAIVGRPKGRVEELLRAMKKRGRW
jgi:arsenate reductase